MKKISLYIGIIILLLGIYGNANAQNNMLSKKQEKIITISAILAQLTSGMNVECKVRY